MLMSSASCGGIKLLRPFNAKTMHILQHVMYLLLLVSLPLCHATSSDSLSSRVHHPYHRRLDEGLDMDVALDLAKYSIKFERCDFFDGNDEESERRRIVTFRLCANKAPSINPFNPSSSSSSCDASCDSSEHGEIQVDLESYLEATIDHRQMIQEEYCETCNDCHEQLEELVAGGQLQWGQDSSPMLGNQCSSIDTSSCYGECMNIENIESNGYIDAIEFVECQQVYESEAGEEVYYMGAMCASGGSRIKIGVFLDDKCTISDPNKYSADFKNEDGNSMKLSYHLLKQTFDADNCVASCLDDEDIQRQTGDENFWEEEGEENEDEEDGPVPSIPEINAVCENLYYSSSLYSPEYYYYTPAPTVSHRPTSSNASETCVYKSLDGTFFAGKHCEFEATSVCEDNADGSPHFCTNDGECSGLGDGLCICPSLIFDGGSSVHGKYCEFVQAGPEEFGHHEGGQSWGQQHQYENVDDELYIEGEDNMDDDNATIYISTDDDDVYWADDDAAASESIPWDSFNYTVRERVALSGLYRLHGGDWWENKDLWLASNSSVCDWYGVTCNEDKSVTSLELSQNQVFGNFYDIGRIFLRHLANLTMLNLASNRIYGEIPAEIGDLYKLRHLKVGNNGLVGGVPISLSQLPHLESLDLQGNRGVTSIQMNYGYFNLRHLDLADNQMSGTVQYDLFRLDQLEVVSLRNNNLIGGLNNYSLLENLTKFDISGNKLSGVLPIESFSENPKLQHLDLSRNNIAGTIAPHFMKAAFESGGPHVLDLSFNEFEGTIPNFDVNVLDINVVSNRFTGIDPEACEHQEWNRGATANFGCDGIMCQNGTASPEGRHSKDNECEVCGTAYYYGTVGCKEEDDEYYIDDWIVDDDEYYTDDWAGDDVVNDDCTLDCLNGGICVKGSPFLSDSCECVTEYAGERCQHVYQPQPPPTSSYLQIITPKSLIKPEGYNHRAALFGPVEPTIIANIYYADSELCGSGVDTSKGYPIREMDADGNTMLPWPSPYILMVDRGSCTFVTKVRNAQNVGAQAVIIADNVCQCAEGRMCASDPGRMCESSWPILADDGSAVDISIPAFIMLKQDADSIKAEVKANSNVVMEMTSTQIPKTDQVEYELWTTPMDIVSREFLLEFKDAAQALSGHAQFTPRVYIYDGTKSGCRGVDGENQCYTLCTNAGRYCATDPDNDLDSGISGADVVGESLRWLCILETFGYVAGVEWWDYISNFIEGCASSEYFSNEKCGNDAMENAGIDPQVVSQCIGDYGGLDGDVPNKLLEEQLNLQQEQKIVIFPTFRVNNQVITGGLYSANALKAICAGFALGSSAPACGLNTVPGPSSPDSSLAAPGVDTTDLVDGYVNFGRGSCLDNRGKMYSFLQNTTTTFPDAEACAKAECDKWANLDSYRGFEFSVVGRCTCLFDMDAVSPIPESEAESVSHDFGVNGGDGVVSSVSGTPGTTCYKPAVSFDTAKVFSSPPSAQPGVESSLVVNHSVNSTLATQSPSSEPSALSTQSIIPTSEFTVSAKPTDAATDEPFSGEHANRRWQVLLAVPFMLSLPYVLF